LQVRAVRVRDGGQRARRLVLREHRVDRRRRRTEAPRGHQRHEQLDPVWEHHGDHVATADAPIGELRRERVDPFGQLGVRQRHPVVANARSRPSLVQSVPGEDCKLLLGHVVAPMSFTADGKKCSDR